MTTTEKSPTVTIQDTKVQVRIGDFGNGRFSPAMGELFLDSKRLLGFDERQAHVTAARLGVDAGQLSAGRVTLAYGKSINKDGKRTLREVTKGMKVTDSWALAIGAICSQLDDLRKQGLECGPENPATINKDIMAFVDNAAGKIEPKPEPTK